MRFIYTVKKDGDLYIIMIKWMNFLSGNEASKPLSNAWIRIGITGIITLAHILENYSRPSPVWIPIMFIIIVNKHVPEKFIIANIRDPMPAVAPFPSLNSSSNSLYVNPNEKRTPSVKKQRKNPHITTTHFHFEWSETKRPPFTIIIPRMYTSIIVFTFIWICARQNHQNIVCPAKTQISLGIFPVWSESSLSAFLSS